MMEQAARASMGKPDAISASMARPTVFEIPNYESLQSKCKPQTSQPSSSTIPKLRHGVYTNIPATELDLSHFEPSPYNFEKDQKNKRKMKPKYLENKDLEEIRPIKLTPNFPEKEDKPKANKLKRHNNEEPKQYRKGNVAVDDGPKIGPWIPVVKKPEVPK